LIAQPKHGQPWPVLLVARELGIGGVERDVAKLALALDRDMFQPHVGCFRASGFRFTELQDAGIPIIEFPVRSYISYSSIVAARIFCDYIRRHRIPLVHNYDVPTTPFIVPVAKLCRMPIVISSQLGYRDLFSRSWRPILRLTDRMVDRIHVNCEAMRRHMIEDEGVRPDRIYLSYNGVDTRMFYPAEQPKPAPLADAELVIGTVCALRPEKRIDLLLDAFSRVRHLRPKTKILIVGSGALTADLQSKAAALGLGGDCLFQPATADVSHWMRAIDIFVLPSDSEAFSNALLESMASGCCPIGSRVGGTPELIEHGQRGFLFERGNLQELAQMLALAITDDARRKAMAQAAAAFARDQLSMQRAAATMGALYASLLDPIERGNH
jgi:glycosyltransferase involved in cell wall biosynthesis